MSVLFLPLLNHVKACLVHERKSKQLTTEKKIIREEFQIHIYFSAVLIMGLMPQVLHFYRFVKEESSGQDHLRQKFIYIGYSIITVFALFRFLFQCRMS